jgi:hypothetical protein
MYRKYVYLYIATAPALSSARASPLPGACTNLTGQQATNEQPVHSPWQGWVAGSLIGLMQALINHLVHEHLAEIAAKSLLDCHVRGIHSIMLLDTPEQRVRLFVATEEHELWRNSARSLGSLAAHPHHCAVTLHCVKGHMVNLEYAVVEPGAEGPYKPYRYTSGILNEKQGGFVRAQGRGDAVFNDARMLGEGTAIYLSANLIHSVQLEKGRATAWFVYEGKEDPGYSSLSYSDQDLEAADFEGLYGKMSEAQVLSLLQLAGLLPA